MRKKLTNNIGLKILSLFVAFAIWLLVVNIDDPVISTTYSGITVDFINANALLDQGKTYEIEKDSDVISVTVTGKRSVVESISKENIRAIADLSNISYTGNVDIMLSTNKNYDRLDSLKSDVSSVSLNIENLKTIHLPVVVTTTGEPADGYVVGDTNINQNTIKISGPESIIGTIAKAETEISVGSRSSDITTTADIKLYDADGNAVDSQYVTSNIKSVNISVAILPTKSVPVEYNYSGNPEQGYMVAGEVNSNYKSVYIAGRQSQLDSINSIVVPPSAIDIEGKSGIVKTNINIGKYLPEGIQFADAGFSGSVNIEIDIEKTVEKTFDVPIANIDIDGIPNGLDAEIVVNKAGDDDSKPVVEIKTIGIASALREISVSDIKATVDINDYEKLVGAEEIGAGTYQMEVKIDLPDMVLPAETHYVTLKLSKQP